MVSSDLTGNNVMRAGSTADQIVDRLLLGPRRKEENRMTQTTEQLTAERGKVHGDFTEVSETAQTFKNYARTRRNWERLTDVQKEGLDMILHKISRILCGDPNHKDHWDDVAGYAKITSDRIKHD